MNINLAETLIAILRTQPDNLTEHDLIRKLAHLEKTSKQEVLEMLNTFWLRFARHNQRT